MIGDGRARRNYIYVEDAARQIAHALDHRVLGTHVIAGTEVLSVREMLCGVCAAFLPGQHPVLKPGPEAVDQLYAPSLEFPPTRSFAAALADIRTRYQ
ncbi:MAG: NAD-dependent epimerase/dehydratase family protein [Burkholderiales bacterium]